MYEEPRTKKGMFTAGDKRHRAAKLRSYAYRPLISLLKDLERFLTPQQRELAVTIAKGEPLSEDVDYITMAGNLGALVSEKIIETKWKNGKGDFAPKLTPRGRQYFNLYLKEFHDGVSTS